MIRQRVRPSMLYRSMRCLFGWILTTQVFAADIQVSNHIEQSLPVAHNATKTITLDSYMLSDKVVYALQHAHARFNARQAHRNLKAASPSLLPRSVQLGMNNIPALDQGRHGTCVTFAVTAAIDASLNRGQYTSQLCLLRFGQYLERTNWVPSGWDGLSASILLLDRINQNGLISLENQERYGCGGVYVYPLETETPSGEMSKKIYDQYREMLSKDKIIWSFLWSKYGFLFETDTVEKTKLALSQGNRVLVAIILPRVYLGVAGATGQHHVPDDTWLLTSEIENGISKKMAGHGMIVTGYDDKAYAVDRNGHTHRGLFTLRSSWGPVADEGDFYMSYDYFDALTIEAIQIGPAITH